MKRLKIVTILLAALISAPLAASATSHQDHGDMKDAGHHGDMKDAGHHGDMKDAGHHGDMKDAGHHGDMKDAGHSGMASDGAMMIVGNMVSKGVKGMAHLKDVSTKMAEMGMKETHHFMIAFIDEKTGDQIETGTVALKITNPDAKVGDPIPLMGMAGHFGADVTLDEPGEYHFKLGTKLADGTKRKYHFHHVIK